MSAAHAAKIGDPRQRPDREAAVNQPVVHDEISDPEEGHPGTGADHRRAERAGHELTAKGDQRRRYRGVDRREYVVLLEDAAALAVVRRVEPPEPGVPHPTVEDARPGLHRGEDDRGDERGDEDVAHGAPP
jgi:hypothetical protein